MSKKIRGSYIAWFVISVLLVILPIWIIISADSYEDDDIGVFYLTTPIMFISAVLAGYAMKRDYTMSDTEKIIEKQQEDKQKEMIEDLKSGTHIENIAYVSGHHTFTTPTSRPLSLLAIKEDILIYCFMNVEKFRIPISQIQSVIYDLSENITLTRAIALGLGALVFKKKTYYLIIEYITENGLSNTLVFSPDKKNNQFLNELNAARNKFASVKKAKPHNRQEEKKEDQSLNEKLTTLKDLLNQELISIDDYNKKKADLLNDL